jgi:hypothetical protein
MRGLKAIDRLCHKFRISIGPGPWTGQLADVSFSIKSKNLLHHPNSELNYLTSQDRLQGFDRLVVY